MGFCSTLSRIGGGVFIRRANLASTIVDPGSRPWRGISLGKLESQ